MNKKQLLISLYYDDSGEAYFILPSGYENKHILVNESPADLSVKLIDNDHLARLEDEAAPIGALS
jgi:hypothetical protein